MAPTQKQIDNLKKGAKYRFTRENATPPLLCAGHAANGLTTPLRTGLHETRHDCKQKLPIPSKIDTSTR